MNNLIVFMTVFFVSAVSVVMVVVYLRKRDQRIKEYLEMRERLLSDVIKQRDELTKDYVNSIFKHASPR